MTMRLLLGSLAPRGARARLSVLIFHRVLPAPDPLFPGEPDAASFEAQMRWVREWFNVMPLGEAAARLEAGALPPRSLSITFDDGYADNATVALPILQRLGMTATFFVATGYLNGGRMWNDTVIESVRGARTDALDLTSCGLASFTVTSTEEKRRAIGQLLGALKYLPQTERERLAGEIARRSGAPVPHDLMMCDAQVRALDAGGMSVGAHTVSHPILARLPADEAAVEIRESVRYLGDLLQKPISLFAYPNGKPNVDYTAVHVQQVRDLGIAAAVSTASGAARCGTDPLQIPRFTPWDRRRTRYGLRMADNLLRGRPEYASATVRSERSGHPASTRVPHGR